MLPRRLLRLYSQPGVLSILLDIALQDDFAIPKVAPAR